MRSDKPSGAGEPPLYRIGVAAQMSGLSAHTIRVWERRYGAVTPARTDGGGRCFTPAEVTRLALLKRATDAGHAIGHVARLPDAALRDLVDPPVGGPPAAPTDAARIRRRFIDAVDGLDTPSADRVLSHAALVLPPRELVHHVVAPVLSQVGARWERGELRVAHEHAATSLIRNLLGTLLRLHVPLPGAPTALAATLEGERHELGVLMAAVLVAARGWRVIFLGADLPLAELVHGIRHTGAEAVLLSAMCGEPPHVRRSLADLRSRVPATIRILVGGAAAPLDAPDGIEPVADFGELERTLRVP